MATNISSVFNDKLNDSFLGTVHWCRPTDDEGYSKELNNEPVKASVTSEPCVIR